MHRKVLILLETLGAAVLLVGCGAKKTQESKKDSQPKSEKVHKKQASSSSSSSSSLASSTAKEEPKDVNESGIDDTGFKKTPFPSQMQGTWYGWDKYSNAIKTVTFADNKWITGGTEPQTLFAYDGSARTASDQAAFNDPSSQQMDANKQNKWAAFAKMSFDKRPISQNGQAVEIVNLRGWYQSAGDGSYYYITTVNINGQPTQVLTEASGAGIWVNMHYYHSKTLAESQKDAGIETDVNQDEDYSDGEDSDDSEDYDDEDTGEEQNNYQDNEDYDEESDEY